MTKPHIVIAGGGIAGHKLAYAFQNEAEVTLIDPKSFFEIPMAAPRLLVEPNALPAQAAYDAFLPSVRKVTATLTRVSPDRVEATNAEGVRQEIPFDFLVLATGANYQSDLVKPAGFVTEAARHGHFDRISDLIERAGRIMVVGGGAVGVETVGETIETFPGKEVTLVHGGQDILPVTTPKACLWAREFLTARGVRFILGERLVGDPPVGDVDAEGGQARTDKRPHCLRSGDMVHRRSPRRPLYGGPLCANAERQG